MNLNIVFENVELVTKPDYEKCVPVFSEHK